MDSLWQDFRFALRTLRKNLSVTLLAIVSLALAIAGNTAVYSLVNSFLHRPLPYRDVERLMAVGESNSDLLQGQLTTMAPANYLDIVDRQSSFQEMAGFQNAAYTFDDGGDRPEQVTVGAVTPGFFQLLGSETLHGRTLLPEEGVRGRERVVLLSHDFWSERYGGRSDLAGETLKLNGELYDVVGVAAADFEWFAVPNTDLWVPLVLEPGSASRQQRSLLALGRLADGVAPETARAEMDTLMAQLTAEHPEANRGYRLQLLNLRHDIPDARNQLFMRLMQGALLFVLLIACANVANLLLSRSHAREREIAIRNSIGASRRQIIFQLFTESMVMAVIAGILGVALGYLGMKVLSSALAAVLPSFWIPTLDQRVLAYSLAMTLLGGILFGLAPVIQTSRFDLTSALKDGTQSATTGGRRRLMSNFLVVLEIALALAFLAGAGVTIRTFQTMQNTEAGFDTANLLIMRLDLPENRYGSDQEKVVAVEEITARLGALPGVRSAIVSNIAPRWPFVPQDGFEIDGRPVAEGEAPPQTSWLTAGPGYFETLGIPLRRGRVFTAADDPDAPRVAVVNEAMAERLWPGESPLGQGLTLLGERREIVGVVATVRHGVVLRGGEASMVYLPWSQQPTAVFGVGLKTEVDAQTLAEPARRELLAFDRSIALTQVQTLDQFIERFWVGQQVFTAVLAGFGTLALLLAALGTYGVLAYSVARRTHEIGIRMAVGAGRGAVVRMVVRQGLVLGVAGIACGIPLVLVAVKVIAAIFSGLVPVAPAAVLGAGAVLAVMTMLASAVPARRAASVDPLEALRWE